MPPRYASLLREFYLTFPAAIRRDLVGSVSHVLGAEEKETVCGWLDPVTVLALALGRASLRFRALWGMVSDVERSGAEECIAGRDTPVLSSDYYGYVYSKSVVGAAYCTGGHVCWSLWDMSGKRTGRRRGSPFPLGSLYMSSPQRVPNTWGHWVCAPPSRACPATVGGRRIKSMGIFGSIFFLVRYRWGGRSVALGPRMPE